METRCSTRRVKPSHVDVQLRWPASMAIHVFQCEAVGICSHNPEPNRLAVAAHKAVAVFAQSHKAAFTGLFLVEVSQIQLGLVGK
jgi:hypothetical protein